jgi:hypothetical protein
LPSHAEWQKISPFKSTFKELSDYSPLKITHLKRIEMAWLQPVAAALTCVLAKQQDENVGADSCPTL